MKTTISFLLLLLAVSTPIFTVATSAPEAVRDIRGKKIRAGVDYYILPVVRGRGGGLTLGPNINNSCPYDVVQEQNEIDNGLPLTFTPVNPKKGVIRVSTDLNIKFSAATICVQSTVWRLSGEFYETIGRYLVTSGGVEGNPGQQSVDNWFKIEKYGDGGDDYKLFFCPTVCNYCKVMCRDIGIYVDDKGVRRLALSDVPFRVMFKKV